MKPILVKIEGSLAARYVDGKFNQMVTIDSTDNIKEDIEYFRVNGIEIRGETE